MMDGLSGFAPVAALLFLIACVLWLAWRGFRRLVSSPAPARQEPAFHAHPEMTASHRELALSPAQNPPPAVPDAADILALKASIDALTKQIATLEKRLIPANSNIPPLENAPPIATAKKSMDALAEVPLVVPERRR